MSNCKSCNNSNDTNNILSTSSSNNNSIDSKKCYESKYSNNILYKVRKNKITDNKNEECCQEIDLENINRVAEWKDGLCLQGEDGLNTGYKRRDVLIVSSKEESKEYVIPVETTPYYISSLTKLTLKESIDLLEKRSVKSTDCKNEFCNDEVSKEVVKDCPPGFTGTTVTYTIPECTIISNISKEHANTLAELQLQIQSNSYAQCNGECLPIEKFCNDELSETRIKTNCPIGQIGLPVTYTVPEGEFCSARSKENANQVAQAFLERNIDRFVLTSDECLYCTNPQVVCNEEYSEVLTKECNGTNVSQTYTVPAGKYCLTVTENRTEAQALAQANQQAIDEVQRNAPGIIASLQCPTECNTQVLFANIRNTKTSPLANTYSNPLDHTLTWTQNFDDIFESQPAVQAIKSDTSSVFGGGGQRFRLELFRNGTKIIDSQTFIQEDFIQLVFNVEEGDEIRYLLTFDSMFGVEAVSEAFQRIGCPPAIEDNIEKVFNEGDGIE